MVLEIKGTEKPRNIIKLQTSINCVMVQIDGEIVARFYDDGSVSFYGQQSETRYTGTWKK